VAAARRGDAPDGAGGRGVPRRRGRAATTATDERPGGASPGAVAGAVAPRPPASPRAAAALIERPPPALHCRGLIRLVAPAALDRIWRARRPDCTREAARVAAFLELLRDDWFAVAERQHPAYHSYADVTAGIPLARCGWDDEDLAAVHDLRPGVALLFALAEAVYEDRDYRIGLLDELRSILPDAAVDRVPIDGVPRARLRAALDGGPFAGLANFADWIARATGLEHLDTCFEDGVETPWTRANLLRLRGEWPRARAVLDRIDALAEWLEADEAHPAPRFDALLTAALGGVPTITPDDPAPGTAGRAAVDAPDGALAQAGGPDD